MGTGSVITPSQLINNHLVRAGVHLFTRDGKVSSKSSFIFFLLLDSFGKGVCCQCPDSDKLNVSYSRKTYQSSRILDKSEIVPHVIPERHKTVKPQISSNNSSQSPPAYKLVRVPHTQWSFNSHSHCQSSHLISGVMYIPYRPRY